MEQLNRIELRGHIGTVRTSEYGDKTVCHLSVATNAIYRNQSNTPVEETTWHSCTVWSNRRYPDLSSLKVGAMIHLVGRTKNNKYIGSDGQEKYTSEVQVVDFEILSGAEPLKSENLL